MSEVELFEKHKIPTLDEFNQFNKYLTGFDVKNYPAHKLKDDTYLVIFHKRHPMTFSEKNIEKIIRVRRPYFILQDKICYLDFRGKKKIPYVKTSSYYSNMLIFHKDQTDLMNEYISKYLAYFFSVRYRFLRHLHYLYKWIEKIFKKVVEMAQKRFSYSFNSVNLDEILKANTEYTYGYYCPKCNKFYFFNEEMVKCNVCSKYLIPIDREVVDFM